jgi:hypothetical protein
MSYASSPMSRHRINTPGSKPRGRVIFFPEALNRRHRSVPRSLRMCICGTTAARCRLASSEYNRPDVERLKRLAANIVCGCNCLVAPCTDYKKRSRSLRSCPGRGYGAPAHRPEVKARAGGQPNRFVEGPGHRMTGNLEWRLLSGRHGTVMRGRRQAGARRPGWRCRRASHGAACGRRLGAVSIPCREQERRNEITELPPAGRYCKLGHP